MTALCVWSRGEGSPVENKEGGRWVKNPGLAKTRMLPFWQQASRSVGHIIAAWEVSRWRPGRGGRSCR